MRSKRVHVQHFDQSYSWRLMRKIEKSVLKPLLAGLAALTILAGAGAVTGSLALGAGGKPMLGLLQAVPVAIDVQPIATFEKAGSQPDNRHKLIWRGGLVLSSKMGAFGGYSGLILSADGQDMLAISDAGGWLKGRIRYNGIRPVGLSNTVIGSLRPRWQAIRRNHERDAEDLSLARGSLGAGEVLISFENFNRIIRYPVSAAGIGTPLEIIPAPSSLGIHQR